MQAVLAVAGVVDDHDRGGVADVLELPRAAGDRELPRAADLELSDRDHPERRDRAATHEVVHVRAGVLLGELDRAVDEHLTHPSGLSVPKHAPEDVSIARVEDV